MPRAGRPPGRRNTGTLRREREIAASGLTPLDYMLKVMRNTKTPAARRDWAASAAAPYVHPRLASTESHVTGSLTLKDLVEQSLRVPEPPNANVLGVEEKDADIG